MRHQRKTQSGLLHLHVVVTCLMIWSTDQKNMSALVDNPNASGAMAVQSVGRKSSSGWLANENGFNFSIGLANVGRSKKSFWRYQDVAHSH